MGQYFDPVRSFKCVHKQDKYVEIFGIISYGYCWAIIGLYLLLGPGSHKPLSYSLGVLKFFVGMSAAWSVETGPKRRFKKLIFFFQTFFGAFELIWAKFMVKS